MHNIFEYLYKKYFQKERAWTPFPYTHFCKHFYKKPCGGVVAFAPKPFHQTNPIWQLFPEPDGLYGSIPQIPKIPLHMCGNLI
jgi:hypothetical protein